MHNTASPFYLPLRFLHILAAMLYTGGLMGSLLWKLQVDRSADPAFAARAHRTLRKMDAILIGPAALVVFAAGYSMIRFLGGKILDHLFVFWGLITFFVSALLWWFGMRNLGDRLAEEAKACEENRQPLSRDYAKRSAQYVLCAGIAMLFVVITAILMVFKLPAA